MIRVGFVWPCWGVGGGERWHLTLVRGLVARGRVRVAGVGIVMDEVVAPTIVSLASLCPVGFGWDRCRDLAASCDVLVVGGCDDLSLLRVSPMPRVLYALHGGYGTEACALAAGVADRLVAVSTSLALGLPSELHGRVSVVPNGVDPWAASSPLWASRARLRRRYGVPADAFVVGYVGRLVVRDKRADLLPSCMNRLPPRFWALIVGDGYDEGVIRSAATAPERTVFVGPVERPGEVLAALDVLVNPSSSEGFGLSACEAILAGVPVIATRCGVFADHPHLARLISSSAMAADLAAAIRMERQMWPLAVRRAEAASRFVAERFSLDRFVGRWEELILGDQSGELGVGA